MQLDISDFVVVDHSFAATAQPQQVLPANPARIALLFGVGSASLCGWGISNKITATTCMGISNAWGENSYYYRDYPGLIAQPIWVVGQVGMGIYIIEILYYPPQGS